MITAIVTRAVCGAALLLAGVLGWQAEAAAQATCFGRGSVLTCLDPEGGPSYQVNCFGNPKFQTCIPQTGSQFSMSSTGASTQSGNISSAFQSPLDSGNSSGSGRASSDPASGRARQLPSATDRGRGDE